MRTDRYIPTGPMVAIMLLLATTATALSAQGVNRASAPVDTPSTIATTSAPKADADVIATPLKRDAGPSAKDEKEAKEIGKDSLKPLLPPGPPPPHIALILPSASKSLGKVADAVRMGFLAGAGADGKNAAPYRVYVTDDEAGSLAVQVRKAVGDGAVAIIGGVTRDGANVMLKEASFVPTLSLNAPSGVSEAELPEHFFHISLNLDWEARLAARAAAGDGLRHAAVVAAKSALAKRIQDSFEREFMALGGEIAGRIFITGEANDGAVVTKGMAEATADCVFLVAEAKWARIARPYLPQGTPVFATSLTIDPRADAVSNLDLDSVRFMEMPWFVQPDHPAVMAYAKPTESLPIEYERLYALGIDAWRLGQLIARNDKAKSIPPLDGVTGRIALEGHQFVRTLSAVELHDGKPVPFKPAE